ncbi:MAG: SWIM zinc finger family protein [Methylococcaceae bacterium]|nr:SWIM zinc finger family protein [Methylococcaceae bacterium]
MKTVRTWWGRKFIEALEGFIDTGRLARGRAYANENRISRWAIEGNRISASIRGNVNPYYGVYQAPLYETFIELKPIAAQDWRKVIQELGNRAAFVSRLLLNEVPDNIEEPFEELGLRLLPGSVKEMKTECSCPDWANPCKHVAGLDYFLAARLDQDPFLLFELRGLPRAELLRQLRDTPLGRALAQALSEEEAPLQAAESYFTRPIAQAHPSPMANEDFWRCRKRLPEPIEAAIPPAVSALAIKKGGDFPAFWNKENSFIETMEAFYEAVRKRGKNW